MKKVIRLTESDLTRIVKRVIKESFMDERDYDYILGILANEGLHPNSEWFDEFEQSRFYDDNMTDDEYAESLHDFIIQGDNEEDMGPLSEFTNEELEEIKYKVIRYLQPGFFDEWEAENYLLYNVSGGNKHLYNSLVEWLEQNGVESYHLKKIK